MKAIRRSLLGYFLLGGALAGSATAGESTLAASGPVEFLVAQRSAMALPGSDGELVISLDDITAGQVGVSLSEVSGTVLAPQRSCRPGDQIPFQWHGGTYAIELTLLRNFLIGQDVATFRLMRTDAGRAARLTDSEKIEVLLQSLRPLEDVRFVRNGQEHSLDEALQHLRTKWQWLGQKVRTPEEFITKVGTGSSTTGDRYLLRFADGREMSSEEWFRRELRRLESGESSEEPGDGPDKGPDQEP